MFETDVDGTRNLNTCSLSKETELLVLITSSKLYSKLVEKTVSHVQLKGCLMGLQKVPKSACAVNTGSCKSKISVVG